MNVHNPSFTPAEPAPRKRPLGGSGRLRRMSRNPVMIALGILLAGTGIAAVVSYIQSKPVTLNFAVGPRQSEDFRLVQQLSQFLARERAPVRLNLIRQENAQSSAEAIDAGTADLAVVRRDVAMPKAGQVVAIHRRNVAVLIVPPADVPVASAAARKGTKGAAAKRGRAVKSAKPAGPDLSKPVEKIEDLQGRTVAIVGQSSANVALLHTILGQYGVPPDKVASIQFSTEDLTAKLRASKFDALLAVGPIGSKITAEAVTALTRGKDQPTFLEIGSSEAIEQQNPVYQSAEIPAGAFGGSRPAEAIETIGVSHYIVARRSLDETIAGNFTRWLFETKQAQGGEFPAFTKIESPDTDKAATLAVHPGALAYLEGEQKSFFERYSEAMYWGLMLVSFFGSGAAWLASYSRTTASSRDRNDLEGLIAIVKRARGAGVEELEMICIEIDDIIERAILQIEAGEIDQNRSSAITLAAEQARRAVKERRTALMKTSPHAPRKRRELKALSTT